MAKLDKEWLGNHLRYAAWRYAALVVLAILGWSLIFTMTEYRTPPERRVEVYFTGPYADPERLNTLVEDLREAFPEIEEINSSSIYLEGDDENNYYNEQLMALRVAVGDGDIYLLNRAWFYELAADGILVPLDEFLESGELTIPETADLTGGRLTFQEGEYAGQEHLFGIPLTDFYGFIEHELYDNRRTYIAVSALSKNPEGAIKVLQWLVDNRAAPKPEWLETTPAPATPSP